jgi:hypothetical protein
MPRFTLTELFASVTATTLGLAGIVWAWRVSSLDPDASRTAWAALVALVGGMVAGAGVLGLFKRHALGAFLGLLFTFIATMLWILNFPPR